MAYRPSLQMCRSTGELDIATAGSANRWREQAAENEPHRNEWS